LKLGRQPNLIAPENITSSFPRRSTPNGRPPWQERQSELRLQHNTMATAAMSTNALKEISVNSLSSIETLSELFE
jgi:hypothetical protein